jgi:transposase-like protein
MISPQPEGVGVIPPGWSPKLIETPGATKAGASTAGENNQAQGVPFGRERRFNSSNQPSPDAGVRARQTRRRFTTKYKLEILRKADACTRPGQVGALLRKEGLYSSHLVTWRKQREEGLTRKKRGRKAEPADPRVKKLEQENRRLARRLEKAEAIIDFQKKVHELLGIPLKQFENEEDD